MAEDTNTYAPKSPDLSSFYSAAPAPPTPPLHNLQHNQQHLNKLQTAAPPVYEYSSPSPRAYHPHQSSSTPVHIKQEQPPHYPPSVAIKSESVFSSHQPQTQTHHRHQHQQHQQHAHQPQYLSPRYQRSPPQQHQQHPSPQHPPQSAYGIQPAVKHQEQYQPPPLQSQGFLDLKTYGGPTQLYDIPYNPDSQHLPQTPGPATMPPRKNTQPAPSPPPIDPSPIRTKFPTARIKRIMQADEEVGKVAQQTPIAVGKALEMFMIAVVSRSAEIAREKNSKRVTAQMLKQVIETDGQYDFLADIAAKVGDEEKRGSRSKAESESEEEMEVETKKKGKGGRKKKVA